MQAEQLLEFWISNPVFNSSFKERNVTEFRCFKLLNT